MTALKVIGIILLIFILIGFLRVGALMQFGDELHVQLSVGPFRFTLLPAKRSIELKLKNFYDEAYFMVRINEGTPGEVSGGKLTHLTGNLYLLQAKEPTVTIEKLED